MNIKISVMLRNATGRGTEKKGSGTVACEHVPVPSYAEREED